MVFSNVHGCESEEKQSYAGYTVDSLREPLNCRISKGQMSEAMERVENNETVDAKRNVKPTAKAWAY